MNPVVPVILAGGIGERFWPLSRSSLPKQLLCLTSKRTLAEEALIRAAAVKSPHVTPLIVTGRRIAARLRARLPKARRYDAIVEPEGKNTAPAIALAAAWIEARYGESLMVVLPADHDIRPLAAFVESVRFACSIASAKERLVVFGVKPTRPETGYGYIELGEKIDARRAAECFCVERFIEKPDGATAARFFASPIYKWNSGMFVWKTSVLLEEVGAWMPALRALVREAARDNFSRVAVDRFYRKAQKESIDYGIMERSRRVAAVVGTFSWDDIGSWESMSRIAGANGAGTTTVGKRIFEQDCLKSIIVNKSPRAVAVVGCPDIGVFATEDAVLVIARSQLPELKKYLGEMKKSNIFPKRLF